MLGERTLPPVTSGFVSGVSVRKFRSASVSIFRSHQEEFLRRHGPLLRGTVVEIGADPQYGHEQHLSGAARYVPTNIEGPCELQVDATAMPFGDGALDAVLCVSVVAHIRRIEAAFEELTRVIRPGGMLLLTVPFCWPVCFEHDFWRLTDQALIALLGDDFEIVELDRLGGRVSTAAALLQRPVGRYTRRYAPMKAFGLAFTALLGRFDQPDDSPLGYGMLARRL